MLKLGIKARIRVIGPIEELAKEPNARGRPDILKEHRFAPAEMRDNNIRLKPLGAQLQSGVRTGLGTNDLTLQIRHLRVHAARRSTGNMIGDHAYPLPTMHFFYLRRQGNHLIPARGQIRGEMLKLSGKILVNK